MSVIDNELSPLQAYNLLMAFASRHGENALRLALHAALPQVLRTDILHLLRLNFVPESMPELAVEADVLFAPFCQDLGNGYYRIDQNVRLHLLQNLDQAYAEEPNPRSVLIARFLLSYIEQKSRSGDMAQDRLYADYLEVERWGAFGFLDPEAAATQLAAALQQATSSGEIAVRIRVAGLATALSTPLARYGKLLTYAAGLEAMETGRIDQAKQLFESLGDSEIEIGKIRLKSPHRVLQERLPPVETIVEKKDRAVEPPVSKVTRNTVFICYNHRDKKWLDQLLTFLKPLAQVAGVELWDDTRIKPGSNWWEEIRQALAATKVAVFLVSPYFLASDYITKHELPPLLKAAEQEGIVILQVILGHCLFEKTELSRFQVINDPHRPLDTLSRKERDKTLLQIAKVIGENFDSVVESELEDRQESASATELKKGIYLSYGRNDDKSPIRKLVVELRHYFGKDLVWMADQRVQSDPAFDAWIRGKVKQAAVMLVVIGPHWLSPTLSKWVHTEVKAALESNIVLIPVLVGGVHFPSLDDLPAEFGYLSDIQFVKLNDDTWSQDSESLIQILKLQMDNTVLKDETIKPPRSYSVFISSTFSDLKEQREAVYQVLRKLGHNVIPMEEYLTSDERPLDKSISDIAQCDVFIMIIGWRYGYIPKENNQERLSIIELEYRLAQRYAKPCLIFLLSEEAPWLPSLIDSSYKRIKAFRDELMRAHVIDTFRTIDELSAKVSSALQAWQKEGTVISKEQARPSSSKPKPNSFDVYLCHNSEDKPTVRQLAQALEARGLKIWLDEDQTRPGQSWMEELENNIETIHAVAILVGKSGLGPWQNMEIRAFINEFVNRKLPVIPVLLPGANQPPLPIFLKSLNYVDLNDGLTEKGLNQLEWGITGVKPGLQARSGSNLAQFRIYLASPGDVLFESKLAREAIVYISSERRFRGRINIEIIAWDQPGAEVAMEAGLTPQEAIALGLPKPEDCDLAVIILWSRIGTPLPANFELKEDGTPYLSGTEWEYLNAIKGYRAKRKPRVWIYRRQGAPDLDLDDPNYASIVNQFSKVKKFFESFTNSDGSLAGGLNSYETPDDFRQQFEIHLRDYLGKLLESSPP